MGRESYEKKKFAEIRSGILTSLDISPKKVDELSKDTGISRKAVQNHLNHLWKIGKVCPSKPVYNSDDEYWMLRR